MKKIEEYIKKCRKLGFKDEAIKKYMLEHSVPESYVDESFKKLELNKNIYLGSTFIAVILMIGLFAFNPQFIGFVTQENMEAFNDSLNLEITNSKDVIWTPNNNGELMSLSASGKIIGNGSVKTYLKINDTRYLILDSETIKQKKAVSPLTGLVIEDITTDEGQTTNDTPTQIPTETPPENSLTEENIIIEQPIENANQNITAEIPIKIPIVNSSETANETIVEEIDNTIENETIIESPENNTIIEESSINSSTEENATVIPEEIPLQEDNTTVQSNKTTEMIEFEFSDVCSETCLLSGLQSDAYTLEFEIEGDAKILINTLAYSIKTIQAEENLTQINETIIIINETLTNITINETINETINVTINETSLNLTINKTLSESNTTINGTVEIGKPVFWKQIINKTRTTEITLPQETFNITTKEDLKVKIKDKELTLNEYNLEKQKDLLKKNLEKLKSKQEKQSKKKQEQQKSKIKTSTTETESKIQANEQEINTITSAIAALEQETRNITIDQNITITFNNTDNLTNTSDIIEIEYYTEGPTSFEEEKDSFNKLVTISSNLHYTDIKAYTDIVETKQEMINLYWQTLDGKTRVYDINYIDSNNNGLVDRIEWTVPHLSNETYEVNISVLNLHSYPMVGAQWVVQFVTTGKANLTITAINGTVYGQDIQPYVLRCDENILNYTFDGSNVNYPDFECNGTAYFSATELKQGLHTQKFTFGGVIAYAYNFAGNLPQTINIHGKLTNSTSGLINTSTNFTFSIYSTPSGGTADWAENQTINVSEGIYTAILGSVTPITVNFSAPYWLGIAVNGDSEMSPRINLTNTPYSYNSFYAQQALTVLCTDCVGNNEVNTTGTFNIDGFLNASKNITLGDSIVDTSNTKRFTISSSSVVIDLT